MKFDDGYVQNDSGAHYNYHQEYQTNHVVLICGRPVRELFPDPLLNSDSHWAIS